MSLLGRPEWSWRQPIDLADITVTYEAEAAPAAVTGSEEFTSHIRPLNASGQRYQRYSQAIRDLAQPTLFENRYSWRLIDVELTENAGTLRFGDMNYFDAMDASEALAHETVAVHLMSGGRIAPAMWRGLPEHDGNGSGADYTTEPFRSLDDARRNGSIHIYGMGFALGALDLWAGLETVAVIDAPAFDEFLLAWSTSTTRAPLYASGATNQPCTCLSPTT